MKKIIKFNHGIIEGYCKELIIKILPELENSFKQRKQYFEYYFTEVELELTLENINQLSQEFNIQISFDTLKILI